MQNIVNFQVFWGRLTVAGCKYNIYVGCLGNNLHFTIIVILYFWRERNVINTVENYISTFVIMI